MRLLVCLGTVLSVAAQTAVPLAPVITPRGVINAFTQQPAPSQTSPGSIIWISGLNLGPPDGAKAEGAPLPTKLADIEVLVNERLAGLYSVDPARIVARVPNVPAGLAEVVVRRGEQRSRPARIFVNASQPSIKTANGSGYGEFAPFGAPMLSLTATGLPQAQNAAQNVGETRAFVGGLAAKVESKSKDDRPGEFEIAIETPVGAQEGDIVALIAANRMANLGTLGHARTPALKFLKTPDGTPELRDFASADLRGQYVVANAARDDKGCYASVLFDFARGSASRLADCLTVLNRNASSPVAIANDGAALAALLGPAESETLVSSKVQLFTPAADKPKTVELPNSVSTLTGGAGGTGDFLAVAQGNPPKALTIDSDTGEVREAQAGQAGAVLGAPGVAVVGAAQLRVDLGDGLNQILSQPIGAGQNVRAVVVGDDDDNPKKAKIALLNNQNEVTGTRAFPDDWLPLVAPRAPQQANPPGGALPQQAIRLAVAVSFDAPTRIFYVVSKKSDGSHGLVLFPATDDAPKVVAFPDGWFVAACTAQIQLANLELSRRLGLLASKSAPSGFANPCPAEGFLLIDMVAQTLTAVALPGAGQFNASGGASEMNDYMFGSNTDPARRGTSDTLYVLDGVSGAVNRLDLPPGITGFNNLSPIPVLGSLLGLAVNQNPGDAGLVLFDLESASGKVFPVPEGFATVQLVGVSTTTRKIVARGMKPSNAGSQFLVYDLISGDLAIVPNPDGVAFVGPLPAVAANPGAGGQPPGGGAPGAPGPGAGGGAQPGQAQAPAIALRPNFKANTVGAMAYDAQRRQLGLVLLQIN